MSAFLTLVVYLPALHHSIGVTLPKPYADVDACWAERGPAISEFVEGARFDYAIRHETCGPANEHGSTETPAPVHLRDLKLPRPENSI